MNKALTIAVLDHCLGSDSHEFLGQKVAGISFRWVLDSQPTRQWIWDMLVDGEKSIGTCGLCVSHLQPSSLYLAAPVAMFPKWLISH